MKHYLKWFISGVVTSILFFCLTLTALAATGQVSFNNINLTFNGQSISKSGENYALENGTRVPSSIIYTDEQGGGTTYLPVRRISQLLGVNINWDNASKSVVIGNTAPPTNTPSTEPTNTPYKTVDMSTYEGFREIFECTNDKYNYPVGEQTIRYFYEPKVEYDSNTCAIAWKSLSKETKEAYLTKLFYENFNGNEFTDKILSLQVSISFIETNQDSKNIVAANAVMPKITKSLYFQY